jgi:hypothetical protein
LGDALLGRVAAGQDHDRVSGTFRLSWPFRKWRSGRPNYYWGRMLPITYPSEMVDRSGWEPRGFWITFCVLLIPGLVQFLWLAWIGITRH